MITVSATELEYIDPRSNSEKFYRVFRFGTVTCNQYGRIGTYGTFTPRKDAGSEAKAAAVAQKAVAGKLAKGYNVVAAGSMTLPDVPNDAALDKLGAALPANDEAAAMPTEREDSAAVVEVNQSNEIDPGVLHAVIHALDGVATRKLVPSPTNPTRPMLATSAKPSQVQSLLESDRFDAQLKLDGDRVVVEVIDGQVKALNRAGQPKVKNVSAEMLAPFRQLTKGRWVFDGEVVGRTLWLFDMPAADFGRYGYHDESSPWSIRDLHLRHVFDVLLGDNENVRWVPTYSGDAKAELLDYAAGTDKEGVIFRDVSGAYESGKRSKVLWKFKFENEADCVVKEVAPGGKESVVLGTYRDGELVKVGHASTIGKSPTPQEGDVWEVKFLYVVSAEHPTMVQARLVRKRTDKSAAECHIDQFATAVTDKAVGIPHDQVHPDTLAAIAEDLGL